MTVDTAVSPALAGVSPRKLGFNISVLAGSQAITWSLMLVWTVIVPRLLGPSGMGVIVAASSVAAIFGVVLGFGTKTFLVREFVVSPDRAGALISTAIVLRICLLPLFAAASFAYSRIAHLGSQESWVLYLATGATFLALLTEPVQALFQAQERMEYLAYSNVITSTVQSLLGVALALVGFRAKGLTGCSLVITGVVLLLNTWWARGRVRVDLRTDIHQMRSLIKESLAYWSFGLFFMIYLWIDSVILSLMTNSTVVGWYGVSTKLFTSLMFVPVIIGTAWLPRLVRAFEESPERLRETARRPIEIVVLLGLPICVAAAMTARPIIALVYGQSYREAAPILIVLAFVIPTMYLNIMLNQVVIASRRQSIWTWLMALATVVNPVLNVLLIPVFQSRFGNGGIGAAVALGITEVVIVAAGIAVVGRRVLPRSSVLKLLRGVLAACVMLGVMAAARPLGFVASATLGILTYACLARILRLASREEWNLIRDTAMRAIPGARRIRRHPVDGVDPSPTDLTEARTGQ